MVPHLDWPLSVKTKSAHQCRLGSQCNLPLQAQLPLWGRPRGRRRAPPPPPPRPPAPPPAAFAGGGAPAGPGPGRAQGDRSSQTSLFTPWLAPHRVETCTPPRCRRETEAETSTAERRSSLHCCGATRPVSPVHRATVAVKVDAGQTWGQIWEEMWPPAALLGLQIPCVNELSQKRRIVMVVSGSVSLECPYCSVVEESRQVGGIGPQTVPPPPLPSSLFQFQQQHSLRKMSISHTRKITHRWNWGEIRPIMFHHWCARQAGGISM